MALYIYKGTAETNSGGNIGNLFPFAQSLAILYYGDHIFATSCNVVIGGRGL